MKSKAFRMLGGAIIITIILGIGIFAITRRTGKGAARIISSNFIGYDLARAVIGDVSDVSMLLKPGAEAHDFEPTPEDIINIKNADLFIYVGGESDEWVANLLSDNGIPKEKTLCLMDLVEVKEEELAEGMEEGKHEENGGDMHEEDGDHHGDAEEEKPGHHGEEAEYDEHIWTSPVNAMKLVNGIKERLSTIHPEDEDSYTKNASSYASRLSTIDQKIRDIVKNSSKRELIFGDRFPFRYFVDEYGLEYYAAFPGCAEQTEASSQTIAFLVNKAKADGIKTILKIELTSDKLARAIAEEVGARVMTLNAAHNISQEDFDNGLTYADIMESNIKVLEEALK